MVTEVVLDKMVFFPPKFYCVALGFVHLCTSLVLFNIPSQPILLPILQDEVVLPMLRSIFKFIVFKSAAHLGLSAGPLTHV